MSDHADISAAAEAKVLKFTIPSDFEASQGVQQQIMAEVERLGYCEAARFAIKLGLEEGIVNAIKHGNKFDARKSVYVEAEVGRHRVRMVIEDEGPGFDRECVPDPRCEENLEKCSGRGILLIEAYMSRVEWSNKGRRLTMYRTNEPDGAHLGCGVK